MECDLSRDGLPDSCQPRVKVEQLIRPAEMLPIVGDRVQSH